MDKGVKSPCIQVCKYNEDGFCMGCYRSMGEITRWLFMSEADKLEILKNVEIRKKTPKPGKNDYDYFV